MAPNASSEDMVIEEEILEPISKAEPRKYELVYWNIVVFIYYHLAGLYGLYLALTNAKWATIMLGITTFWLASCGLIAGTHRLWSHRCYKATKPLQLFLMLGHSIANQHSVIHWVRDHRLHHKYSDTDADPHNASRGFFYSHIGWLLVRKHAEVKRRGKKIDISDVMANSFLRFQHRNKMWFIPLMCFGLPTFIAMFFWEETFTNAWNVNMSRYILNLNLTFMINSVAHCWGYKPYDKTIAPSQNQAMFYLTLGEGSHNYHHVFPWDYRSDEIGYFSVITKFIDGCAALGLAYDRRKADEDTIVARARRTGDGSVH